MEAGLFEALRGRFADETPLREVSESQHRLLSVMDNLNRLFNSRRGSIAHLPEYGLPDLTEIYVDAPESFEVLRKAIREAVERYEPRLRRVRVDPPQVDRQAMHVVFLIAGELTGGGPVQFETTFASHDLVHVNPRRRP